MSARRLTAFLAVVGAAAVGAWIKTRQRRLAHDRQASRTMDTDDDATAEIIRRARPALERALAPG